MNSGMVTISRTTSHWGLVSQRMVELERAYAFLLSVDEDDRPSPATVEKSKHFLQAAMDAEELRSIAGIESIAAFCGAVVIRWVVGNKTAVLTLREGQGRDTIYRSEKSGSELIASEIADARENYLVDTIKWISALAPGSQRGYRPARVSKRGLFRRHSAALGGSLVP